MCPDGGTRASPHPNTVTRPTPGSVGAGQPERALGRNGETQTTHTYSTSLFYTPPLFISPL